MRGTFYIIWIFLQIQLTWSCKSLLSSHQPPPKPCRSNVTNVTVHTYDLQLNKLVEGPNPVIPNLTCNFSMKWDFERFWGFAHLLSIQDELLPTSIELKPLGEARRLAFMSNMKPTPFNIGGKNVTIFRVVFIAYFITYKPMASIMFNNDGSVIQATENTHFY